MLKATWYLAVNRDMRVSITRLSSVVKPIDDTYLLRILCLFTTNIFTCWCIVGTIAVTSRNQWPTAAAFQTTQKLIQNGFVKVCLAGIRGNITFNFLLTYNQHLLAHSQIINVLLLWHAQAMNHHYTLCSTQLAIFLCESMAHNNDVTHWRASPMAD